MACGLIIKPPQHSHRLQSLESNNDGRNEKFETFPWRKKYYVISCFDQIKVE